MCIHDILFSKLSFYLSELQIMGHMQKKFHWFLNLTKSVLFFLKDTIAAPT